MLSSSNSHKTWGLRGEERRCGGQRSVECGIVLSVRGEVGLADRCKQTDISLRV